MSGKLSLLVVDMDPSAALVAAKDLAERGLSASFAISPIETVSNPRIWSQVMLAGHRLESSVLLDATPDWTSETATLEAQEAAAVHGEIFPFEPAPYIVLNLARFDRVVGREVMVSLIKNGLDALIRCGESVLLWDQSKGTARIAGYWPDARTPFGDWLDSVLSEEPGEVIPIRY